MTIDAEAPRPPYLQLADALRRAIESGDLPAGAKPPSGRSLARSYGVALTTAQKAVDELQRDGLVKAYGTRGVYVGSELETSDSGTEIASLRKDLANLADRVTDLESKLAEQQ